MKSLIKKSGLFILFSGLMGTLFNSSSCTNKSKIELPSPTKKSIGKRSNNQVISDGSDNSSDISSGLGNGSNSSGNPVSFQDNDANITQPNSLSSKKVSMGYSGSEKEDQSSIVSKLRAMSEEEKKYCETFSQELSAIEDVHISDQMIQSFVKKRNARIKDYNEHLKNMTDFDEKQRLMKEFCCDKEMFEEINALNRQYFGTIEENIKKVGDITEKYNGYSIESIRWQIRDRVEALMKFVSDTHLQSQSKAQDTLCAICDSTGSVGLLPCGDYMHTSCLVEKIIATLRMGHAFWTLKCPGSCGKYLDHIYFIHSDNSTHEYR